MPSTSRAELDSLMLRDAARLHGRFEALGRIRSPDERDAARGRLDAQVATALSRVARRAASVPVVTYPPELPITARRDDIAAAIAAHQVVIVAGETGSGKTTQLPKICLELGRGVRGLIGHTQPRRIAARTVAERIAEEIGSPLGAAVGWKVRFTDQVGPDTLVKLMTDGILLAEIAGDRMLRQYDTLIIDEAHERSLNIDFLLGYLTQLLPRRPDLKVVITSATIDPERFARHFGGAPIIEVSGRTFPVEVRYRPVVDPTDPEADPERDQTQAILDAVDELQAQADGDILVFLSGEREIRDTAEALAGRGVPGTEVLPLYGRLSVAEQHRVFAGHTGPRVVLATNVAETSLTVPGIRFVIDPGTARISRYSHRTKVQRLPIEAISQASARQRSGRCGRTSDGICIRLYTEDDYAARPEFTEPEILRTNLASVILQMAALGLGDVEAFPFLEPPERRSIADGVTVLFELGALEPATSDNRRRLTAVGRRLATLPVDPRLARMIVEADRNGCLADVLVIAAALSIQDPRERPLDQQQAADEAHARFADAESDFLGWLTLWRYLGEQQQDRSGSSFRRMCRTEFLHYLRLREWQDLVAQLQQIVRGLGLALEQPERPDAGKVHASLLAGLLSQIGVREGQRDFLGTRGAKFVLWPGSALARRPPRWVMAAELVETSRLFARTVARTDPAAIEALAGHLVVRTYSEPRWDRRRAAVLAIERVTLYGVPLVTGRQVTYGGIDPAVSRDLFIRHALVEGDWDTRHAFFGHNRALLDDVGGLEDRTRRRGLRIDDDALFELYDRRVGAEAVSGRHFDTWWKATRRTEPDLLTFDLALLTTAADVDLADYPDSWPAGGLTLPLSYAFAPGAREDGITVDVPLAGLPDIADDTLGWQVPGRREELVTALLRGLPKPVRRMLTPIADHVRAVLPRLDPATGGSLLDALEREIRVESGVIVDRSDWRLDVVPDHLRPTYRVVDDGRTLATGKDLGALREQLRPRLQATLARASGLERTGLTSWSVGTVPRVVETERGGQRLTGYPALADEAGAVALRVVDSAAEARALHPGGVRRLLLAVLGSPARELARAIPAPAKLALRLTAYGSVEAVLADIVDAAADEVIGTGGGPAWDEAGFAALVAAGRAQLLPGARGLLATVAPVLTLAADVARALGEHPQPAYAPAVADMRAQLAGLVYPGFVAAAGRRRLTDVARYLRGIGLRLDKLPGAVPRDSGWMAQVSEVAREVELAPAGARAELRWAVQELRISFFAQQLGTSGPVSAQRIYRAIDDAAD